MEIEIGIDRWMDINRVIGVERWRESDIHR